MKKLLCLSLVLLMLVTALVGCGGDKPDGEYYSADLGFSVIFDGDELIMDMGIEKVTCQYEIDGDKITMEYDEKKETVDFSFDGDTVTIGGDKFTKVKD